MGYFYVLHLLIFTMVSDISSFSPSTKSHFDLVVIGGGSAGLTAADFATKFGFTSVIIERDRIGGDCTWSGCVPSKTLLSIAKKAHAVRTAERYGIRLNGEMEVDMGAVRERIRQTVRTIYENESPDALKEKAGIDTIIGEPKILSPNTLSIGGKVITALKGIVICTGAAPAPPDLEGIDSVEYLTNENVFDIDVLPKKMTIVGGGPIGCEMAQAFSRLGSDVTLVALKLLPTEEPEVSTSLEEVFKKEGISIVKGRAKSVSPKSGDPSSPHALMCVLEDKSEISVEGDALLLAVGRRPRAGQMGLDALGIQLNEKGGIATDGNLMTACRGVYAAGDCTGDRQFTHYAGYQGAVAARNALLPLNSPGILSEVPACTFTAPEISSVGISEAQAKNMHGGDKIGVAMKNIKDTDRAQCEGEEDGFIKIIYLKKNNKILGASIMAGPAGEMISEISVAMAGGIPLDGLAPIMHSYPTYSFDIQFIATKYYYDKLLKLKPILTVLGKILSFFGIR
mmetsp:Transcript_40187/g.78525  ORF Transcript_40187/g.78525 Transcript_40187/m.78525 type:complete len:511 (-) Transcript_40187:84-1616(-)